MTTDTHHVIPEVNTSDSRKNITRHHRELCFCYIKSERTKREKYACLICLMLHLRSVYYNIPAFYFSMETTPNWVIMSLPINLWPHIISIFWGIRWQNISTFVAKLRPKVCISRFSVFHGNIFQFL